MNGKVVKKLESEGVKLNEASAFEKLLNEIPKNLGKDIKFNKGLDNEIERVLPKFSLSDFDGANEVISEYSTEIKSSENKSSIKASVHAINKVVLFPKDIARGLSAGVFSFNKYLALDKVLKNVNDEGYNQVASTLNAAVLNSGIEKDAIIRSVHLSTIDYIDPGLDAVVKGNVSDYKFKNTFSNVVIIFAQIKENKIVISLVGRKQNNKDENKLEIEVVQRFDPSVVNTENQNLGAGEKRLISPGREGIKVNVYRVTSESGVITNKIMLYNNIKYESVKSIVETGPIN